MTPPTSSSDDKLIIALDFGTTYSGIAYCFTNQRDCTPISIKNWPGAESPDAPKIPTLIRYDKKNPDSFTWGAALNNQSDGIVGVKLLLDVKQEIPIYLPVRNVKKDINALPKPPVEVAADFIGAIYSHAISEISNKFSKDYVDLCHKEYVLSAHLVPAVWSDAAKDATLKAAEMAGLSPVHLIKEPEAAALWTAKKMDRRLNKNDTFIVCDAGGGTVDLISYQVEAALPRLEVKEIVPGTGGMAGSLGLNKRFSSEVENLVGEDQWFQLKKSRAFHLASKQFDREIKRSFRGGIEEEYFINFPTAKLEDDLDNGLEASTWRLTGLINDQVQRIRLKQMEDGIKGIFLVGGFGSNQYLIERVRKEQPNIDILQPPDAWAAIAKGAALSRLPGEAIVTSTSATRHYGVRSWHVHDPVVDAGQPTELWRDDDPSWLILHNTLFECEERTAPRHPLSSGKFSSNCILKSDMSTVPKSKFEKKIGE
ncbi:Heat shock 70 kDa protein 12A [Fusarium oxysporum f. sp. cubense race 1]|uniref:Heat shock 70 kDa protein 12A n=1 Tax=Fusarium oxysporum f. sp. cubense (strain race 1) TaxID=1229664 RepID=N4UAK7_FUSC1|nr:Heat shock 70 kDa protein 12A [Fusarium oxysporum f. sp. cubense race 1]